MCFKNGTICDMLIKNFLLNFLFSMNFSKGKHNLCSYIRFVSKKKTHYYKVASLLGNEILVHKNHFSNQNRIFVSYRRRMGGGGKSRSSN